MKSTRGCLRRRSGSIHGEPGKTAGFTLIELLVAFGIVALLIGILLPVATQIRRDAMRTTCRVQLRDLGQRFLMYLQDNHDRLPSVNTMPSIRPPLNSAPSLVELLEPYTAGAIQSYHCPADRIAKDSPGSPPGFETYFAREGSSYQYNVGLAALFAGRSINELGRYPDAIAVFTDYEPFHGRPGGTVAMNAVFLDMRVADLTDLLNY